MRRAARLRRSLSATDVPPNFITTVSGMAAEDTATTPRRRARRVLALAGLLMAIAAAVVFAVAPGGEDEGGTVPEAGSRFRDEAGAARSIGEGAARQPLERAVAQLFVAGFQNDRRPPRPWAPCWSPTRTSSRPPSCAG